MSLRFVLDPDLSPRLRDEIVALWVDVTNAGGAVGFVPPVTATDVRTIADPTFAGIADGPDRLLAGYDGDRLVAVLVFCDNRFPLKAHWCVLKRVMVHPDTQGTGYGSALMREAARLGRELGHEALHVTVRDGLVWTGSTAVSVTGRSAGCRARCGWRQETTGTRSSCGST